MPTETGIERSGGNRQLPVRAPAKAKWIAGIVSSILCGDLLWAVYANFSTTWGDYGWALFLLTPCLWGFLLPVILGWKVERPVSDSLWMSLWGVLMLSGAVIAVQWEGFICVLMALPLVWGGSAIGVLIGHAIQSLRWDWKYRQGLNASVALLLPLAMISQRSIAPQVDHRVVQSTVVVHASPERIWPLLLNMDDLPEPEFWMFRAGVAHPVAIKTHGTSRHCVLSTGDMPEVITVSEPGRRLRFEVLETPPSMREMNPLGEVNAPHLRGYFECERGEFRLEALPNGYTRITGTSWYHHRYAPDWYWSLWTDTIVKRVQLRVLDEIARRVGKR